MNVSSIGFNPIPPAASGGDAQAHVQDRLRTANDNDQDQDSQVAAVQSQSAPGPDASQRTGQIVDKRV